jgi:two-component system, cell cycle sensor histidine kinase and response regulator CckA
MGETEQEATLRRLAEAVAVKEIGIFEHDYSSGVTWASPRFREMLGFEPDEFVSMQVVARLCFPADVPMIQAAMQRSYDPAGDGVFDLVYRVVRKDGKVRWVHGRGATSFAQINGQMVPVRALGTIADVTEQHELKLAVERHDRRLTQATIISQVGVFDWDHDPARPEEAIYWSPTFRAMCRYGAELAPDIDWYTSRVHPDDSERFREALAQARDPRTQAPFDIEYRWLHPSGETRWCVGRSTTSFQQKGPELRPERTVGAVLDITSTRRAAEQLSQRSAILDATPDVVCIADPELNLVFLNQAGRAFAGMSADHDIVGAPLLQIVGEDFDAQFTREGRALAIQHGSWQVEADFVDHAGQARPVSALVLCHWDRQAQLSHFSLVARDLSHEKELEQQMRRAQKMDVIGRLAGGVAHDFNNILSVILGFSESLEDCVPSESRGHRDLQEIRFAVERAAALTRQLLTISRNELVRPRSIDLNEVLKAAGPMFRRLLDARVDIQLTLSETPVRIKADSSQMEQVLLNLVVNARDAMPAGGTLSLELSQVLHRPELGPPGLDLKPGPYVVLGVSDSGQGISPEVRERIFEPFFTTKDQGKGTGLGLATVLGIVEKNGGGIWLHSELEKGTTFKVYLPSTDEPPEPTFEQPSSPVIHRGGTILLVEDEAQLRTMVTAALERAGYRVLAASGPVEALGLAQGFTEVIDLLVTDVVMPQMTGPVLAAELQGRRPGLPVLFMSGYTDDAALRSGLLHDQINFLPKPLSAFVLLRKVAQAISRRSASVA